jgi:hypothetical protein
LITPFSLVRRAFSRIYSLFIRPLMKGAGLEAARPRRVPEGALGHGQFAHRRERLGGRWLAYAELLGTLAGVPSLVEGQELDQERE